MPQQAVRSTRRREETRRRLVAAAYEVFAERGIRDTPVEAICDRAGFTRGAFYSNFASKEDLFLVLWQEHMHQHIDRLQSIVDDHVARSGGSDAGSMRDRVTEVARTYMTPLTEDADWYLLVSEFRAHILRLPDIRARVLAAEDELHEGLARAVRAMVDGFGMKLAVPESDVVLVLVAVYEMALLRAALAGRALPSDDRHVTELLPRLADALVVRE